MTGKDSVMNHRHTCTADDPWTREKSFYGDHPDATERSQKANFPHGDIVTYDCPHCGLRFRAELPQ